MHVSKTGEMEVRMQNVRCMHRATRTATLGAYMDMAIPVVCLCYSKDIKVGLAKYALRQLFSQPQAMEACLISFITGNLT